MVVYVDVLLFENFIVNMFLLLITSQTIRIKISTKFLILSALAGTVYVLTMLFPSLAILTRLPFQLMVALLMVYIILRKRNIFFILKCTGLFILYSMLLSGFCVFIQYKQSSYSIFMTGATEFSYKWLLVSVMVLYMILNRFIVFISERKEMLQYTYTVEIVTRDFTKTVKAFLDTGNELREPVTNLPVMIVEKDTLKEVTLRKGERLFIPYKVVNGSGGRLEGFKPDYVKIYYQDKKFELRDVIIGFCDNKLSELGEYEALLSRGIV